MMKKISKFLITIMVIMILVPIGSLAASGDTVQYTGNLIPTMTSNSSPSGVASTNYTHAGAYVDYDAYKAFDKLTYGESRQYFDLLGDFPGWIRYDFPTKQTVGEYTIKDINYDTSRSPKDFIFQGSNDGTNWIDLDTRVGVTWTPGEKKLFQISNPTSYSDYRVYITANGGGRETDIDEIEMMGVVTQQTIQVNSIAINKTSDSLNVGQSDTLIAMIQPSNATNQNVTWTSSDPTIATVDSSNGKVTALKVGTVIITAISADNPNIKATCTVTVTDPSQTVTTGNRCILEVTMINNVIKEYDLSMDEFNSFMTWYDARSNGTGKSYFTITKHSDIKPFTARKETLSFDKIISFEEKDYTN